MIRPTSTLRFLTSTASSKLGSLSSAFSTAAVSPSASIGPAVAAAPAPVPVPAPVVATTSSPSSKKVRFSKKNSTKKNHTSAPTAQSQSQSKSQSQSQANSQDISQQKFPPYYPHAYPYYYYQQMPHPATHSEPAPPPQYPYHMPQFPKPVTMNPTPLADIPKIIPNRQIEITKDIVKLPHQIINGSMTAEKYDLEVMAFYLSGVNLSLEKVKSKPKHFSSLHIIIPKLDDQSLSDETLPLFLRPNQHEREYFWFTEGVTIAWGYETSEMKKSREEWTKKFEINSIHGNQFTENTSYLYNASTRSKYDAGNDVIMFGQAAKLEKLAASHAIAKSVITDYFEDQVDHAVAEVVACNPKNYHSNIVNSLRQLDLLEKLFVKNDLTSSPDYLWESSEAERLFTNIFDSFVVKQRVSAMAHKLDISRDKLSTNIETIKHHNGMRMEILIAGLITVEIIQHLLDKWEWWRDLSFSF